MSWDSMWDESFLNQIAETEAKTGTNPVDWRKGGRATKANPDKEDKKWWDENGKRMFFEFITAWQESGLEIWVSPEGTPGIEIEFNNYFGDVLVKAFADAIAVNGAGELCVIDFKTGSHIPDSSMQLGLYASLMELQFGVRPSRGYFYDARNAVFKEVYGLHRWSIPVLTELFTKFDLAVKNEVFLPNVGLSCHTCGVKDYCYAQGGELSKIYDPLASVGDKNV